MTHILSLSISRYCEPLALVLDTVRLNALFCLVVLSSRFVYWVDGGLGGIGGGEWCGVTYIVT